MFVDASVGKPHADPPIRGGIGAILTQVQISVTRAIGYFSRQFRDSESRYNAYNAELCGLVAALEHFMTYLKNSKITAFTDHMPIVKASTRERTTADALLHKLSVMELTLIHITGTKMPADALSRQALQETKGNMPTAASSIMEALKEYKEEGQCAQKWGRMLVFVICGFIKNFSTNSYFILHVHLVKGFKMRHYRYLYFNFSVRYS